MITADEEITNLKLLVCRLSREVLSSRRTRYHDDVDGGDSEYLEATEVPPVEVIESLLGESELVVDLIDSDETLLSIIADTNADGWSFNSYDSVIAEYFGFPRPRISFATTLHFNGDQDEDKSWHGTHLVVFVHGSAERQGLEWEITQLEILNTELAMLPPTYASFEAGLKCGLPRCPFCAKEAKKV